MTELKKILHVDDDDDILEIAKMALELVDNFELHQFNSAQSALPHIERIAPQLLLFDVMMPGMTGPQLSEMLRSNPATRNIPTIFMTAKAEDTMSMELIQGGALTVITKPFDPMTLGTQIREAWKRAMFEVVAS